MKFIAFVAIMLALPLPAAAQRVKTGAWQIGNDSYHLYYGDLDVNTRSGRAVLLSRIERIARKLCPAGTLVEQNDCVRQVIAKIDKPEVVYAVAEHQALLPADGGVAVFRKTVP